MTLAVDEAEAILRARLGEPAKSPTQYVIGFSTPSGRVLAIERRLANTRIWFQPPEPPALDGVHLMSKPSNGNSNLNGPLLPLRAPTTLRVEVDSAAALNRFLDWYLDAGVMSLQARPIPLPSTREFETHYRRFDELLETKSGDRFRDFDQGLPAEWERYKPRLRAYALTLLDAEAWRVDNIGSGEILNRTIQTIEIHERDPDLVNNFVFWQNRYGDASRNHRLLLEAQTDPALRTEVEDLLFGLYRSNADEEATFDRLSELSDGKYPLLAYLFFLKDVDRFMPIQPTGFDRAFRALNIDFATLRQCNWRNYATYNAMLDGLRPLIAEAAHLPAVRLVDAHSFCWIFSSLLNEESKGTLKRAEPRKSAAPTLSGREASIIAMGKIIKCTVRNANGQAVQRTVKNKELRMSDTELQRLIPALLERQGDRCALTGLPLQFLDPGADPALHPSVDRIDSNGHHEAGNLQIVCRFVNFWKSDTDNEEFKRLLALVRRTPTG